MQRRNAGATYIASNRLTVRSSNGVVKWVSSAIATLLVLIVMISGVGIAPHVAYADTDNSSEESQKAEDEAKSIMDSLNPGIDDEDKKGSYLFDQVGSYDSNAEVSTFQGLLWSVFGIRYINKVAKANVPSSTADTAAKLGLSNPSAAVYACNTEQLGAGTAYYHNCDVPNLMTEFLQDAYSLFDRSGVQGAESQNAYAGDLFGIPKNLPGDGSVPVNSDVRAQKYTGLELYGYSLPWTTYLGEWDHIKTQSEARLLSNFGFFDHIALTGSAIGGGIANGLTVAVDNFSSQLGSNGNIFAAIGGFYSGFFQGAAAGAIAPVLDSSDLNVLLSFAWYRVGYANTAYGLRQLTDTEIAAAIRLTFLQMMSKSAPAGAELGEDLLSVADGGKKPRKPVSKCEVLSVTVDDDDKPKSGAWTENSPPSADQLNDPDYLGVTREACESAAQGSMNTWIGADGYDDKGPNTSEAVIADFYKYAADGNRAADTVATWKSWNSDVLTKAAGLGIDCSSTYPSDSALADSIWEAYKGCWGGTANGAGVGYTGGKPAGTVESPYQWNRAANEKYEATQATNNTNWLSDVLSQVMVQSFMQQNQEQMNFNAPWRRYICLNADGTDMMTTNGSATVFVYAFTVNGSVNPACNAEFRSPIQNGVFGSGYTGGEGQNPANDTRHISNFGDPVGIVLTGTLTELATQVQAFTMGIGQFATKLSGEVIAWTYMPILDSLGITDIIVDLIEGFRDSLFFPLASMVIAFAALGVLFRAFKNQAYREGFVSVAMICLVYISGAFLMYKTTEVIDFVQGAPAVVEEAVVGSIFSASTVGNDELCTSTSAAVSTSGNIFGKMADTSASQSTRELICYNWRTFTFTPWVYGQFGVGFESLYANGASGIPSNASTWDNTNESLVGSAGVNMGNGTIVENWALYQLDTIKTGTATTADTSIKNGRIDPNFYRIVDAQFGPNNGAGTDDEFAATWSGADQNERFQIAVLSPILGVFGAVVVIAYSVTKIVITLLSTLMLVFLPFAFLLGLFPSKRPKLKDYILAIVGMMIQRVVLIIVLSLFFVLLLTFAGTGQGTYLNTFLMGMLTCLVFWMWRKDIMGYVFSSIGNPQFGRQWREDPGAAMREWPLLKTGMQKVDQLNDTRTAAVTAAMGSVLSGRAPLTVKMENGRIEFGGAVAKEVKSRNDLLFRTQRRQEGFEGIRSGIMTAKKVAKETRTNASLDGDTQRMLDELFAADSGEGSAPDLLQQQQTVYNDLKKTPGYREIDVPVFEKGVEVKDKTGQPVYRQIIVSDDKPGEEIAAKPADTLDQYSRLTKPQDRRLAQQYKDLEAESFDSRRKRMETAEVAKKLPDAVARDAYARHTTPASMPTLEAFRNEDDMTEKAKLVKNLQTNVTGDLETVMASIDRDMPDSAGFTDGDRRRVKNLIKESVKEAVKQETTEYKMERIETHLQKVVKQEWIASDPREAAKKAINDMNKEMAKAADKAEARNRGGQDG